MAYRRRRATERLHASFLELPRLQRRPATALRQLLLLAVVLVVAAVHGAGLRRLGVGRLRFVADVMVSSRGVVCAVLTAVPRPATVLLRGAGDLCQAPTIARTLPTHRHMGRVDGGSPHVR